MASLRSSPAINNAGPVAEKILVAHGGGGGKESNPLASFIKASARKKMPPTLVLKYLTSGP
jgi:predicted alpha/beta-hydrolase family hydrolase